MYRILDESTETLIGIKIEGKLTNVDYDLLIPYFEGRIKESESASLLCDMTQYKGIDIAAFWEDFTLSIRHLRDFTRIAIVGDQRWMEWYTKIFAPLVKTNIRYFPSERISDAWAWLEAEAVV